MSTLKGLNPALARDLVTKDFRRGDVTTVDAAGATIDLELGRAIDLEPLREVIFTAMKMFESEPLGSDPWLGPRIHATLRLTRREAADRRIWQYLTVVEFPHYVRWRWQERKAAEDGEPDEVTNDRFLGPDDKNALAWLWWTAELTRNGPDYRRVTRALKVTRFAYAWLKLNVMHHRAAALAAIDFLTTFGGTGPTSDQGRRMAKAVNAALRTVCLDALAASPAIDAQAVADWANEKIDVTTVIDELPTGPDEESVSDTEIAAVRKILDDLAARIKLAEVKAESRSHDEPAAFEQSRERRPDRRAGP
ncbi:MAG: DUF6339 family protein [Gemmataceae bacterium]